MLSKVMPQLESWEALEEQHVDSKVAPLEPVLPSHLENAAEINRWAAEALKHFENSINYQTPFARPVHAMELDSVEPLERLPQLEKATSVSSPLQESTFQLVSAPA